MGETRKQDDFYLRFIFLRWSSAIQSTFPCSTFSTFTINPIVSGHMLFVTVFFILNDIS